MVQKRSGAAPTEPSKPAATSQPVPKRRGRPRAYEPDVALAKAMDVFWKEGFSATSLDDLSAATGMNRPSLYGAFGDKRELYLKTYQRYRDEAGVAVAKAFAPDVPLRPRLQRIFATALDLYLSGEDGPRGCFTVMTAASEAVLDPDIRDLVLGGFRELDRAFAVTFRAAQAQGELPASANPDALAQIASATIHSIAIRARAKVPRRELKAITDSAVELICGVTRAEL